MKLKRIACISILCSFYPFTSSSAATTYYIDYVLGSDNNSGTTKSAPWKRHPGMVGFSGSYVHSPGDVFVFKGGVTWPATAMPLTISNSGVAGKIDTYTVDQTWFAGAGWALPVFDGGGTAGYLLQADSQGYITINSLKFQNAGTAHTFIKDIAIGFYDCHHITIGNSTFVTYTWIALHLLATAPHSSFQNIEIKNNDISNCSMGIVVATGAMNSIVDDVAIHDNVIHDLSSMIGGGAHGDGVHIWGAAGDDTQYLTNLRIYNNLFYGSFARSFGTSGGMTALIYIEDATTNALIYNNVGSYTDSAASAGFGALIFTNGHTTRGGGHQIYNNSLLGTDPGMSAAIILFNSPNTIIKNNILSRMADGIDPDRNSISGTIVDHNDLNTSNSSTLVGEWPDGTLFGWPAWQSAGLDVHGTDRDPKFRSPSDLHLQAGSPCIGAGTNLSTLFAADKDGNPRPATGAWTIGAYEPSPVRPNPPTNLRAVVK